MNEQRLRAVHEALKATGARRVLDLGCGEGKLVRRLAEDPLFTEVVGMDVSTRALDSAEERLRKTRQFDEPARVKLWRGSLMYRDARLAGFDAAAAVEVIEHQDPPRLAAFERVVFEFARPAAVVLTTPNVEYNVKFEGLPKGKLRHRDHRFEWTRAEFRSWAEGVASRHGYRVTFAGIGEEDPAVGPPTQMAVFGWTGAGPTVAATAVGGVASVGLDEILTPFRKQVAASGLSDADLAVLFEEARNEVHAERPGLNH